MILIKSIMLVSLLMEMVLTVDLSLHGANNVWISSNVRSLGCYSPFEPSLSVMRSNTNKPDKIDFTSCNICGLSDFVLVRGAQCICINNDIVANQICLNDTYCNIPCDDDPYYDGDEMLMCGGNLGGSLYCNKQSGNNCLNANFNGTPVDIYREFNSDRNGNYQSLEPCLNLGCGSPPDSDSLFYNEYFPNLNPEDCIVFCTYVKTSYAHAGWVTQIQQSNDQKYMYPTCICSNNTMPSDPEGLPCTNGTCPSILDPVDGLDNIDETSSCGNKQTDHNNWSVYCTTIVNSEVNGSTSCAPYQPIPLSNNSWESCWTSLSSTEGVKSSLIPVTPKETCASRLKSKRQNVLKDGMRFQCSDECTGPNCCRCGNCGNVTSCSFNGSCYDISSDSSNNNNSTDNWRTVLAEKCKNDHPGGHLVAIETQSEHNFISQVLLQASDEKSPVLSSGIRNNNDEFWLLSDSDQVPIPGDVTEWGVQINRDECDSNPCYLMLVFSSGKTSGYNIWKFTRCPDSFLFVCEYLEPEGATVTSTTTKTTATTEMTTKPTTSLTSISSSVTKTTTSSSSTSTLSTTVSDSTLTSPTSTETTRVTTPSTTLQPNLPHENCPCNSTDFYDVNWIINADETKNQSCRPGAAGEASWTCDLTFDSGCRLRTPQPDFSNCQSLELLKITEDVQGASNETELYSVWESLRNFTSPVKTYFGHEIDDILDIIIDIMNQQDWKMNGTENHLEFQLNTTQSGARIIDNLISHSAQWEQLTSQDDRSQKALLLLNVSEDMSFRLTDIAEQYNRSLRCEIYLANVTFSSSYWNGNQTRVDDCDLDSDFDENQSMEEVDEGVDIAGSEVFRRFPMSDETDGSSYLLLPEGAIENHRTHKGAGLLISHFILQQLLPGQNNTKGYPMKINSPLISYTLRNYDPHNHRFISDQIPQNSFVELVYRHGELAKDPPVRTLHRPLNPGETPSAVIGSSFCAFLSLNETSHEGNQTTSWIWDGYGCTLKSTNRTHTVCQCNHLTGFATLMDFHDYTGKSRPLEITSIVCSFASAISLAITFIVLTALRSIKTDRTVITQNLCIFLMFSHVLALTTLNRHYLHLDQVTCAAMGILLHFCLLVSFMWMGIEGLRLCRMVLYVFNLRDWTLYYVLAAYIIPFVIVSVTVLTAEFTTTIISAYTGDEICWLNGANYKWSFAGPVAVIIFVNVIFAMIAVRSSWNLKQNTDRSLEEKIRNAAALLLSLTCLLGISWLTGFLLYAETQVFAYIFTITNGLQGVTIMLFRCFLNDEVRTALKDRWRRHRNNRIGRWSSTMTTNTSSQRGQSVVYTDAASKLKANMKLSQTNSQSSVLSSATKTTDASFIPSTNQNLFDRRQRNNIRTFSGTEISDEFGSEISESFSSASDTSYRHHSGKKEQGINNDGVRDVRRVSFFIQQNSTPSPYLPTEIPENVSISHNSSQSSLVSRRSGNQLFYEQDPSAFF